ncbi:trypsin-like peptidase domain-containing protein [Streptomyces sp. NPDC002685]|uniref:trypsin-like peptidase domain-containing protein n=1 Tax=Streptomyces sp. NPDC002685 TaxID=3154540 RepID=UPI00332A6D5B
MSGSLGHSRVSRSLGRVLAEDSSPTGTCFQVAPGVLITAWHVLANLGCADVGSEVTTDALNGSMPSARSKVVAVDPVCDLAVLSRGEPLEESVVDWAPTDDVELLTKVMVNGVPEVDDPGHSYTFLHATGTWQGWTVRDGVPLGRLSSDSVLPGMSGAPVVRLPDGLLLGVVSARYNSADHWLRDSVWVARTEDLTRLLEGSAQVGVQRRLVLDTWDNEVGTVLSARGSALESVGGPVAADIVGPAEAAREAAIVLTALDDSCRGTGRLADAVESIVSRACGGGWGRREADGLRRRLRLRGLEPRVLLPRLDDHEEAVRRWTEPLPGTPPDQELSGHAALALLGSLRRVLCEELEGGFFAELSPMCRRFLLEALDDGDTIPLSGFLHALRNQLPPIRSSSVQAVLLSARRPVTDSTGEGSGGQQEDGPRRTPFGVGPTPGRPELAAVAVQMSGLPPADPYVTGREELVGRITGAVDRRMTRHGAATAFLCGQPGVGTSVVAVEAARALTPAFPGGVFYVDLQGLIPDADARPDARTVVRIVNEALGLDVGSEMMDDARALASFRAQLHDRRVLLVLDNARDAAHVRPLVKAPPGCGLIVTSRDRAQDYADPGLVFQVGPLDRDASVEVLTRCAEGRDFGTSDDQAGDALHRLAHLCDDVPMALRIAGARMTHPTGPTPSYLVQLMEAESERLDVLDYGDRAVRLAIRLSHDALDPAARRVLRLITAVPGSALTGAELGHCLQAPALRQELLLNRLVDRSLALQDLVRMPAGQLLATFRLFDLVRLFGMERLATDEPPETVSEFQHASVSYLCARLTEITDQVRGAQLSGELDPTRFHAAQRLAQEKGWLDLATDLAIGLHVLYTARGELDAVIGVNDERIALHLRQGRPEDAVKACLLNADTLRGAGASGPAADAARQAADIAREYGLHQCVADAEFKLSLILWDEEAWAESLTAGERAVTTLTSAGHSASAVPVAINNCRIARRMDGSELALRWGRTATELADQWGSAEYRAMACNERGLAEDDAGNTRVALDLYRRAATLWEEIGNLGNAANDYANAAFNAQSLEDTATAVHLQQLAADLWLRGETHPRALEALIDASSLYATQEAHEQAVRVLARAERLALGVASGAPGLLRCEVLVRHAATRLFHDDPDTGPPAGNETGERRTAEAEIAGDDELARVHEVLTRHQAGRLAKGEARREVRSLLNTRTRNRAPRDPPWVYEELGQEPGTRAALGTASSREPIPRT